MQWRSSHSSDGQRLGSEKCATVYGNTALVIGRVVEKGTQNGKSMSPQVRFSRVYVKEKGKWVAVSTQNTPIAM